MFQSLVQGNVDRRTLLKCGGALLVAGAGAALFPRPARAITNAKGQSIVNFAHGMIGTPYRLPPSPNYQSPPYAKPKNVDCSLLVQYCYWQGAGIILPRTASLQYGACTYSTAIPGAMVFFDTVNATPKTVSHVGINLGSGWMIDANSVDGVVKENFQTTKYWSSRLIGIATL